MLKLLLISLFLSSCSTIPDVWMCTSLNESQGYCAKTIGDQTFTVDDEHLLDGNTWVDIKDTAIYMPPESWVKIKSYIIKMCHKTKSCGEVGDWNSKVEMMP